MGVLISDDRLRQMYAGGRGDATARRHARLWGWVQARGWLPRRWITLEVPARERPPILARHVAKVPGGRPHIPVPPGAPIEEFEEIAARYPVFRIDP